MAGDGGDRARFERTGREVVTIGVLVWLYVKHPMRYRPIRTVLLITVIPPLVPAGTIAALAMVLPSVELSVETPGNELPAGQTDRNPSGPDGTTVKFNEYA